MSAPVLNPLVVDELDDEVLAEWPPDPPRTAVRGVRC